MSDEQQSGLLLSETEHSPSKPSTTNFFTQYIPGYSTRSRTASTRQSEDTTTVATANSTASTNLNKKTQTSKTRSISASSQTPIVEKRVGQTQTKDTDGKQAQKTPEIKEKKHIVPATDITKTKMNQLEIQRSITDLVPEFNGINLSHREEELTRFIDASDSIYRLLQTEQEKQTFDRIIRFRLKGDAYIRITHRNVVDYPSLKQALREMYSKTLTLDELQSKFMTIHQSYGETIRDYGFRLMEALDRYRNGYKKKYDLREIDVSYNRHLNEAAVQVFKKGINNIILKEKIATSRITNVEEIITEAEIIEKMLEMATNQHTRMNGEDQITGIPTHVYTMQSRQIICNYCQKPNHTWDICRTRQINESMMLRNAKPNVQNRPMNNNNNNPYLNTNFSGNASDNQNTQMNFNRINNQNRQAQQWHRPENTAGRQVARFQPKYCSHCKTTTGHTFDECRSKFFNRWNNQSNYNNNQKREYGGHPQSNQRNQQSNFNNNATHNQMPNQGQRLNTQYNTTSRQPFNHTANRLEHNNNTRINMINPQQPNHLSDQENSEGSGQQ